MFPFLSVGFRPESMNVVHPQMRHFMNIGYQKLERRKIAIDGDAGRMPVPAGKVARFGDPPLTQMKVEGVFFPEPKAIRDRSGGEVLH